MAGSNYNRGEMEIEGQEETFGGFMKMSMYGGAIIIVALLAPILVFAVGVAWPMAMVASVLLGILIGVVLKFHARWYVLLVAVAVLLSIIIALASLFA